MNGETIWSKQQESHTPRASLNGRAQVDFAIIGGGIAGLTAAYFLRQLGRVVILERNAIGSGSTGKSAGSVVAGAGMSCAELLAATGSIDDARNWWSGSLYGVEILRGIAKDVDVRYRETNCLILAQSRPDYWRMKADCALAHLLGFRQSTISQPEIVMQLGDVHFRGALFRPNYGSINPLELTNRLAEKMTPEVTIFRDTTVVRITEEVHHVVLETPCGEVRARFAVIATNAYTGSIGLMANHIRVKKSHIAATDPVSIPSFQNTLVTAEKAYCYLHRTNEGNILAGVGDEELDGNVNDDSTDDLSQRKIDDFLQTSFRQVPKPTHRWAGLTAYTQDGRPIIGCDPKSPRILFNIGCNGAGYAMLTLGSYMLSRHVQGQVTPYDNLFSPSRL